MPLPDRYQAGVPPALASYSYTDIAEGSGIVEFCAAKVSDSNSTFKYILTTNKQINSATRGVSDFSSFTGDFDIVFNLPKNIKGKAYANIPIAIETTPVANVTCAIKKVDGETSAVTTIGASMQTGNTSGDVSNEFVTAYFDIALTHFKKGDTLRFSITATQIVSGSGWDHIGHNPSGSGYVVSGSDRFSLTGTRLSLFIPFRLDTG